MSHSRGWYGTSCKYYRHASVDALRWFTVCMASPDLWRVPRIVTATGLQRTAHSPGPASSRRQCSAPGGIVGTGSGNISVTVTHRVSAKRPEELNATQTKRICTVNMPVMPCSYCQQRGFLDKSGVAFKKLLSSMSTAWRKNPEPISPNLCSLRLPKMQSVGLRMTTFGTT